MILDSDISSTLRDDLLKLYVRQDELQRQKKGSTLIISGLENEVKSLVQKKTLLTETWETLKDLLDKFSAESISLLNDLLNKGVKAVFHDKDCEVKLSIINTQVKKMRITFIEHTEEGDTEVDLHSGALLLNGGGLLVVVSFIFQVFLIILYNKRRFIALDEQFTNISSMYLESFFQFMQYLHTEMGFDFMMITQDPRFMPYFNKRYEVVKGNITLKQE